MDWHGVPAAAIDEIAEHGGSLLGDVAGKIVGKSHGGDRAVIFNGLWRHPSETLDVGWQLQAWQRDMTSRVEANAMTAIYMNCISAFEGL